MNGRVNGGNDRPPVRAIALWDSLAIPVSERARRLAGEALEGMLQSAKMSVKSIGVNSLIKATAVNVAIARLHADQLRDERLAAIERELGLTPPSPVLPSPLSLAGASDTTSDAPPV